MHESLQSKLTKYVRRKFHKTIQTLEKTGLKVNPLAMLVIIAG